jgi:hypothetical protein
MAWFIVVALVVVLLLVWWFSETKQARIERLRQESSGTWDAAAKEAYQVAKTTNTPATRLVAASIVAQNLVRGEDDVDPTVRRTAMRVAAHGFADALEDLGNGGADMPDATETITTIETFAQDFADDDAIVRQLALMTAHQGPRITANAAQARVEAVGGADTTPAERAGLALEAAETHTNDPQNVHDVSVNNSLRHTLAILASDDPAITMPDDVAGADRMASTSPAVAQALAECRAFLDRVGTPGTSKSPQGAPLGSTFRKSDAIRVFEKMAAGGPIGTLNCTEDRILALVWRRGEAPRNAARETLIQEAIALALADSVENGQIVCVNGRCGRVIQALCTLDFNPDVGAAATFEAYKNQIYAETKDLLDAALERAAAGSAAQREVAKSYEDINVVPDERAAAKFRSTLRKAIARNAAKYKGKIGDQALKRLVDECCIYADCAE